MASSLLFSKLQCGTLLVWSGTTSFGEKDLEKVSLEVGYLISSGYSSFHCA